MTVSIRRATPDDVDFLVSLVTHDDVEPFLAAVRAKDRDDVLEEVERSQSEPDAFGVFVIEVEGELAGTMHFERTNRRSRIASLGGLAVHPDHRGRRIADEAARMFQRHLLVYVFHTDAGIQQRLQIRPSPAFGPVRYRSRSVLSIKVARRVYQRRLDQRRARPVAKVSRHPPVRKQRGNSRNMGRRMGSSAAPPVKSIEVPFERIGTGAASRDGRSRSNQIGFDPSVGSGPEARIRRDLFHIVGVG